jgi:hypothetical protein
LRWRAQQVCSADIEDERIGARQAQHRSREWDSSPAVGRWTGLVACRPAAPSGMTGRLYSEERHPSLDKQFYYRAATFFLP